MRVWSSPPQKSSLRLESEQQLRQQFSELGITYADGMAYDREMLPIPRELVGFISKFFRFDLPVGSSVVRARAFPAVQVRALGPLLGHGLFASEPIRRGAVAGAYFGLVRSTGKDGTSFDYTANWGSGVGRFLLTDAKDVGNETRFINHADKGNLVAWTKFIDRECVLVFFARKNIAAGEQLTFDYGKQYWAERAPPFRHPDLVLNAMANKARALQSAGGSSTAIAAANQCFAEALKAATSTRYGKQQPAPAKADQFEPPPTA